MGVQAGEQPALAGRDLGAMLGKLVAAALLYLGAELPLHRRRHILRRRLRRGRRGQPQDPQRQQSADGPHIGSPLLCRITFCCVSGVVTVFCD
jgi:hypothetical protein